MSDKVSYDDLMINHTDEPTYTNERVDKAIKNMVDKWDLAELYQFAYDEMADYFYDRADPFELDTLMEDHGEKEKEDE